MTSASTSQFSLPLRRSSAADQSDVSILVVEESVQEVCSVRSGITRRYQKTVSSTESRSKSSSKSDISKKYSLAVTKRVTLLGNANS
jgi:stalled ribosome rescue protein Dom34